MQGLILSTIVLLAVLPAFEAGRKKNNDQCSEWTFGECVATSGDCGRGKKAGTRTGENCQVTQKDFKCRIPCANRRENCKYDAPENAQWSECDSATNKMSTEGTLRAGGSSTCAATKTVLKRCRPDRGNKKPRCRYTKGQWSDCDAATGQKMRTDTLNAGSSDSCAPTTSKTKNCRAGKCRYQYGEWPAECTDGFRSRTKTLIRGDPTRCESGTEQKRPCAKRSGKERCSFGPWTDYGECQNGVKTKTRQVLTGGRNCASKGVKTKMCKDRSGQARQRKEEKKQRKQEERAQRKEDKMRRKEERRTKRKNGRNREE